MDENNNGLSGTSRKNRGKKVSLVLVIIVLFCGFFLLNHKSINNDYDKRTGDIEGLKKRLSKILELENNRDFGKIYDNYFSPETKSRLKRDVYIDSCEKVREMHYVSSSKISILDVQINDNVGYIDRIRTECLNEDCTKKTETREYEKFIWAIDNWYLVWGGDPVVCVRNNTYSMPEEFKRAISLMIQRYSQSNNATMQFNGHSVKNIQNCLNIQYAKPTDNLSDAEGMFVFTPSQSMEKFDIFVSPKYSAKDDLLTAILLAHEIQHVFDFIESQSHPKQVGCFETEARAFSAQNFFISTLNNEELRSLASRVVTNSSFEAKQVFYLLETIPEQKGSDYHEKALNFVKASPAYQEQCKDRE